jgi:hypothetical protein
LGGVGGGGWCVFFFFCVGGGGGGGGAPLVQGESFSPCLISVSYSKVKNATVDLLYKSTKIFSVEESYSNFIFEQEDKFRSCKI